MDETWAVFAKDVLKSSGRVKKKQQKQADLSRTSSFPKAR